MKKLVIAAAILFSLASVAEARDRWRGGGHRGYSGHHQKFYGHRHRGRNIAPWVLGGAALGILGAGAYAASRPYYGRCWIERKQVWDRWGNYRGWRDVRVCD